MNTMKTIWEGLDWSYLTEILMSVIPALICITLHELSHGFVAYKLGDSTAKDMGRLTLNPIKHLDVMGILMMIVFHFGWAKPVSVDMRNFKHPKRDMAITALAGPASNFLLAALALFLYGLLWRDLYSGGAGRFVIRLLQYMAILSISLGLFNLIPIPPLDGSKVLFSFLPDRAYVRLMVLERYGMFLLLALVLLMNRAFDVSPIARAAEAVYNVFFRIAVFADSLRG